MDWTEVTIKCTHEKIDDYLTKLESFDITDVIINDEQEFLDFLDENKKYWDYVDEEVYHSIKNVCSIVFYLADNKDSISILYNLQSHTDWDISIKTVKNEDWENNWQAYYKPMEIGDRLLIVPEWEDAKSDGRIKLILNPGLTFGTGSHATTRMCLTALEKFSFNSVFDIGCGSGILGIAAYLLGAKKVSFCDIDELAEKTVFENATLNGIDINNLVFYSGDILNDMSLQNRFDEKYDIILANIVADVIIPLSSFIKRYMHNDSVFICSGIIDYRKNDVEKALIDNGFSILEHQHSENWHCFTAKISLLCN